MPAASVTCFTCIRTSTSARRRHPWQRTTTWGGILDSSQRNGPGLVEAEDYPTELSVMSKARRSPMAEGATKMPVRNEEKGVDRPVEWRPFESLRREVDRLFEDFQPGSWRSPFGRRFFDVQPFWRGEMGWGGAPAVDVAETEKGYEITAELPGMDESNIDVKFADGTLTIKGEKRDQRRRSRRTTTFPNVTTVRSSGHS